MKKPYKKEKYCFIRVEVYSEYSEFWIRTRNKRNGNCNNIVC